MDDADALVLEVLLDDVLTADVVQEAVDEALALLQTDAPERADVVEREIARVRREKRMSTTRLFSTSVRNLFITDPEPWC